MCLNCDSVDARISRERDSIKDSSETLHTEIRELIDRLNRMAGFPDGHKGHLTPGFFRTLSDYGGLNLVRVINDAGGVRSIMGGYHKIEKFHAMLRGFVMGVSEAPQSVRAYQKIAQEYKERGYTAW